MLRPGHALVHFAAGSIVIAGVLILSASLAGCVSPAGSSTATSQQDPGRFEPFDNWYPADITPPAGTQYPCALTALPPQDRETAGASARDGRVSDGASAAFRADGSLESQAVEPLVLLIALLFCVLGIG